MYKRQSRWCVGFALETDDHRLRALAKLEKKCCDLMVVNGPEAMHALETRVEVLNPAGAVLARLAGGKQTVGHGIIEIIQRELIDGSRRTGE